MVPLPVGAGAVDVGTSVVAGGLMVAGAVAVAVALGLEDVVIAGAGVVGDESVVPVGLLGPGASVPTVEALISAPLSSPQAGSAKQAERTRVAAASDGAVRARGSYFMIFPMR
jgi:hypothetical protein